MINHNSQIIHQTSYIKRNPRLHISLQHPSLHLRCDLLHGLPFVITAARLAHIEHGTLSAQVLVAHLQHVQAGVPLVLLVYPGDGQDEIGQVRPVGTAGNGVHVDVFRFVAAP